MPVNMLVLDQNYQTKQSQSFFVFRLLQYIDDIIAKHKDKLLNSDKVLVGKPHLLFDTVYIDR